MKDNNNNCNKETKSTTTKNAIGKSDLNEFKLTFHGNHLKATATGDSGRKTAKHWYPFYSCGSNVVGNWKIARITK